MITQTQNPDFQLGLLHFAHLLVTADGIVHEHERRAIWAIKEEEEIETAMFQYFVRSITGRTERDVYNEGVERLNRCTEEEKLCVFVHLYRLAQADDHLDVKEVRLLLYALKQTSIDFDDIVLSARLAQSSSFQKRVA